MCARSLVACASAFLLAPKCFRRLQLHGLDCGKQSTNGPCKKQCERCCRQDCRIRKRGREEHVREEARNANRAWKPHANTDEGDLYGLFKDQLQYPGSLRPQRHANPDFSGPEYYRIGEQTEEAEACNQNRNHSEEGRERCGEVLIDQRELHCLRKRAGHG